MGQNDYVQTGVFLLCDKGVVPTPLIATPKQQSHHGTMGATIRDNIPCMNIIPFGVCTVTRMPCIPVMPIWENYPKRPWFIEGAQPLLMKSYCRCQLGGTIRILPNLSLSSIQGALSGFDAKVGEITKKAQGIWDDTVFPILGKAFGTAALGPIGTILELTGNQEINERLGKGLLSEAWNSISGLVAMTDPIKQIEMIGGLVTMSAMGYISQTGAIFGMTPEESLKMVDNVVGTSMEETYKGIQESITGQLKETWDTITKGSAGDRAELAGRATVFFAEMAAGSGEIGKLKALNQTAKVSWWQKIANATKGIFKKAGNQLKKLKDKIKKFLSDPVDVVTGLVLYEGTDIELPGPLPFQWIRRWTSDSPWEGMLGYGSHCNLEMRIHEEEEGDREDEERHTRLTVILPDGRPASFRKTEPGESDYNREEQMTLSNKGTHYELFVFESRLTYHLTDQPGTGYPVLTMISNEAGHRIALHYREGALNRITDSAGRQLYVTTDRKKRVTKVELMVDAQHSETLVEYAYNDAGDMTAITNAMRQTTRLVYQNHLMIKKTDRQGHSFYWEYDDIKTGARCIHTWGDGGLLEAWLDFRDGYTIVTDQAGNKTRYDYTDEGYIIGITDPLGNVTKSEYGLYSEILEETDADGRTTEYDYDNKTGRLLSVTHPDGGVQQYSYTPEGRLASETTPGGATTCYEYNEQGLLSKVISADNQTTEYIYNDQNLISKIYAPGKRNISLSYDNHFNLVRAEFPDGLYSEWTYDHRGQVTSHRNASGGQEKFMYDSLGRVTRIQTPDGNDVRLTYNAYKEIIRAQDANRSVEFEYTPLGHITRRKENGRSITFDYDKDERLTSLCNEAGEQYTFTRDKAGRIIGEVGFDGLTRRYERTPGGAVRSVERPGGKKDDYVYDEAGRLCGIEYHDGTFEQYAYNKDGLLIEARNPGSTVRITRDNLGRITEEWQDGHTVSSQYDELSQRVRVTSSLGANLTAGYTRLGQLKDMQMNDWEMTLGYNNRGQEISRSMTGGIYSSNEYDDAGRVTQHSVTSHMLRRRSMRYQWGTNDRLIAIFNELTEKKTTFSYDQTGFLTGAQYDTERLFRVPDAVGNLYRTANRSDRKYGSGGRLLRTEDTKYHYDDEGNLIEKVKGNGETWRYRWNANGSLREVIRPDRKNVVFKYDALGRRTQKTFDGKTTRWVWDGNTPLHEWQESQDESLNENKKQTKITTWIFDEDSFRPAAKLVGNKSYNIVTDYLGTPVQAYNETGKLKWEAELDIYGKVRTFEGDKALIPFRYQGQYEDAETGLYYNRHRYYDPEMSSYLSKDPIGLAGNNPTLYGYVKDVNSWVDQLGLRCWLTSKQKKQIEVLRNGGNVYVDSVEEARKLLNNMPELSPQVDKFPSPPAYSGVKGDLKSLSNAWKQKPGTYRGDLIDIKNPTSKYVHTPTNPKDVTSHNTNAHYNILNHDGSKATIIINN